MMDVIDLLLTAVASYLIGSIPTAYLLGKWLKGIDIREHGSGNVGATNAFRVLGKGPGIIVLIVDIIKGVGPVLLAGVFHAQVPGRILAAIMAVCGHNWTCFLNFRGGKGIATTLGALIGLTVVLPDIRLAVLFCVLGWILCFLVTAYVSVSSIFAAILLPVLMIIFSADISIVVLSIVLCLFVVLRHRPNIQRLFKGQEHKVSLPFHPRPRRG